nr:uncharacterized protein LOC111774044 [Equus caballus]
MEQARTFQSEARVCVAGRRRKGEHDRERWTGGGGSGPGDREGEETPGAEMGMRGGEEEPRGFNTHSVSQLRRPRRPPGRAGRGTGDAGGRGGARSPAAAQRLPAAAHLPRRRSTGRAPRTGPRPRLPGAPSPRTSRPALGEGGRPGAVPGLRARGQPLHREQEPPPAPPRLPRAGGRGSAGRGARGAVRGAGRARAAELAAGELPRPVPLGWGPGWGPGRAGPPGGSAPSPGGRLSARAERRGGAPLGRALGLQPLLPPPPAPRPPAPRRFAGARRDGVTELGRQRCIVGAFKAAGSAGRPLGPTGPSSARHPRPGHPGLPTGKPELDWV